MIQHLVKWWHSVTAMDILSSAVIFLPCMAVCLYFVVRDVLSRTR